MPLFEIIPAHKHGFDVYMDGKEVAFFDDKTDAEEYVRAEESWRQTRKQCGGCASGI